MFINNNDYFNLFNENVFFLHHSISNRIIKGNFHLKSNFKINFVYQILIEIISNYLSFINNNIYIKILYEIYMKIASKSKKKTLDFLS